MKFEIKCVTLSGGSSHHHITGVGSPNLNPSWISVADVISNINNGHTFIVKDPRNSNVEAIVRPFPDRIKGPYIRSSPDGVQADNLLSLPPCTL
jgi:hypothetical protein